uniref:Uncharacterized protein n=1 Tax=Varanus komodoensis TaxID=61221 RepID=A0A8D2JAV4_VARKO
MLFPTFTIVMLVGADELALQSIQKATSDPPLVHTVSCLLAAASSLPCTRFLELFATSYGLLLLGFLHRITELVLWVPLKGNHLTGLLSADLYTRTSRSSSDATF